MQKGDVLGHEFMGEVIEVGPGVKNVSVGDRVVVAFPVACGTCESCKEEKYSLCENTNPNRGLPERLMGNSPCGIFGYSHLVGGYAGGQAEYVRVPFADVGTIKIPDELPDEKVLFLSDIFPTGYFGAEMCEIKGGDTIAVWGCGPVGQLAMLSARLLGAHRVIGIDRYQYRLRMAAEQNHAETINYEEENVYERLMEMTGGKGPDACIDAVGMESHKPGLMFAYDYIKQLTKLEPDRPLALREAILCCKNGGIVSVIGVYSGLIDQFPMGAVMNRALTIKSGQCHAQRYMKPLLEKIMSGEADPSFVITHRLSLDEAPRGYNIFCNKLDNCEKVVLKPAA
jgi:threonine dehydrogenase-like Zn-dependent dehydrogenase